MRKYGFDEEFQAYYSMEHYPFRMEQTITDVDVEKMLARLVSETKELLSQHSALLRDLSIELCLKGSMEAKEMAAVAKKHKLNVLIKEEGYLHINQYKSKLYEEK